MNPYVQVIIQETKQMSRTERVEMGRNGLRRLIASMKQDQVSDKEIADFIVGLTRLFVSADRSCEAEERNFYEAVTETKITPENFFKMTNYGASSAFVDEMTEAFNRLDKEGRIGALTYGIALHGADKDFTLSETELIEHLLG